MSDIDTIKELDAAIIAGINAKDADQTTEPYAADGAIFPPGAPKMAGADAIRGYWQAAIDAGLSDVTSAIVSASVDGDSGMTEGTLAGSMGGQTLTGKYVLTFARRDGAWKVTRDIWNFDA